MKEAFHGRGVNMINDFVHGGHCGQNGPLQKFDHVQKSSSKNVQNVHSGQKAMVKLYQTLYKAPYYEVGFHDKQHFRRRIVKKNSELLSWVLRLRDKYPLFVLSHGHQNPKDARLLNPDTFITNKLFLDFDGEDLTMVKDEVDRFIHDFETIFKGRLYLQFSGGKGYHVYILLPETLTLSVNEIGLLLKHIKVRFSLEYLDESVIKNPLRLARAPFSYHENGNAVKPMVHDPMPSQGLEPLIKTIQAKAKEIELYKKNQQYVKQENIKNNNLKSEITNWNVVDKVFQAFYETGRHVSGTKHIVCCPFHSDTHPSAFYDDKVFHCSTCGITVGSYRLLTELMGKDKGEALDVIKGFQ